MVTAHASVTVSWNTRAPVHSPAASLAQAQVAVVRAVNGTHVVVRLSDGTARAYVATPQEARVLQHLIGTAIRFRLAPRR